MTMETSSTKTYQEIHGDFMRNHTGSDLLEIHCVLVSPVLVFCLKFISLYVPCVWANKWYGAFAVEYAMIVVPQVATVTFLSDKTHLIGATFLTAVLVIFATTSWKYFRLSGADVKKAEVEFDKMQTAVTSFRANILVVTVICILAVDFPIFPRRFAKTEAYGTSLMDTGVGMFVITNAIVSSEARGGILSTSAKERVVTSFTSALPLLLLGLGRVVVLKAIGYHEVASEYGTHWNFFFTLAITKLVSTLTFCVFHPRKSLHLAVLAGVIHQLCLGYFHLSWYVLRDEGQVGSSGSMVATFVANNRGGLVSSFGFVALHLFGVALGRLIFTHARWTAAVTLLIRLFAVAIVLLLLLPFVSAYVEPVSRRLANLAYILTVLIVSVDGLFLMLALDLCVAIWCVHHTQAPKKKKKLVEDDGGAAGSMLLLRAINRHGLQVFLTANVSTGLVNLSLRTVDVASSLASLCILLAYTSLVFSVTCALHTKQIKMWR